LFHEGRLMNSITMIAQTMLRHLHGAEDKTPDESKLIATAIQAWMLVGGSVEGCRQAIAELRRRYSEECSSHQRSTQLASNVIFQSSAEG
jgi:hypothetical protein